MIYKDGVYQVHRHEVTAGFSIKDGKVVNCAPVLCKKFSYWQQCAVWIGPLQENDDGTSTRGAGAERQP